jgi:hypothetical protein
MHPIFGFQNKWIRFAHILADRHNPLYTFTDIFKKYDEFLTLRECERIWALRSGKI